MQKYRTVENGRVASGSYLTIVKEIVRKSDNKTFACKVIRYNCRDPDETKRVMQRVEREQLALRRLNHAKIARYEDIEWGVVDDEEDLGKMFLIMEWCEGQSLQAFINKLKPPNNQPDKHRFVDENRIWRIAEQMAMGLIHCHYGICLEGSESIERLQDLSNRATMWEMILHRDIKPENIMVDSTDNIKIVDFGVAFVIQAGAQPQTRVGTDRYIAPEIRSMVGPNPWTHFSDIFSFGCTLYALCNLNPPPEDLEDIKFPKIYSSLLTEMIRECLTVMPELRPSLFEICIRAKKRTVERPEPAMWDANRP